MRDREARLPALRASLDPLRRTIERQDFLSCKKRRATPITSSLAPFNGRARSVVSNCSR